MAETITRAQYEELKDEESFDMGTYHKLLEEYTGIVAHPYTAFSYYDSAGNYLGDSCYNDLNDLLKMAYVEVSDG